MIKINLLPKKAQREAFKYDLFFFCFVLAVCVAMAGVIFVKNMVDIRTLKDNVATTKQSIAAMAPIYNEYLSIDKQKKELGQRLQVIDNIKEGRALAARILFDIPSITKENVWLKRFKKDEGVFELEGRSLENESVSDFVEALSKITYFKNVELRNVEDVTEDGIVVKKFLVQGSVGQ
jgi:type IV pilus assembly protein PilN